MAGWEADYEMSSWRTWFPATVKRRIPMIRFPRGYDGIIYESDDTGRLADLNVQPPQ